MTVRVAYVGNFGVSFSTESHYAVSLEANGCEVVRIQENDFDLDTLIYLCERGRYDLLLYTRTWDRPEDRWRRLLLAPPGELVTAAVHLDIWRDLDRAHEVDAHSMFSAQTAFTADGDADEFFAARHVHHEWLPAAVVDPALVGEKVPGTPDGERWPYKVAFVGSYGYHPEWPQRPALIDALHARYGDDFVLVGGGDAPHGYTGNWVPTIREQTLDDFYATVPVIVGDSCFAWLETRYWSDRFCETWGRGGYLIFPYIDALMLLVGDYPHYEVGHPDDGYPVDFDGLFDRIDGALGDAYHRDGQRERLGGLVRAEHTYTQRARTMLTTLELL